MRRSSLPLLRCPRCRRGPLLAESDGEAIHFGPARCASCAAVYPIAEGILDLAGGETRPRRSLAQWLMESTVVARAYERSVRPFFAGLDAESEQLLLRALLAPQAGEAILDLSCGSGIHACRMAHDTGELRVLGLDRSAPMLHEAAHHLTEAGTTVDLIRGEAADLPFGDASLDAVLNVASLHLYPDPAAVLRQVARVLVPGGRLVCATLLPERLQPLDRLEARAGVHRYDETTLRSLCESAGLQRFERIRLAPWIVFRAERA
ncbi:methyltransferase domain-containing protein [Vulgatibacter sp.]|uniref:methyltransferase domain-containing protein n=1 Tax=Vulgatibacter sp. TaxID=1971226 RepID=UPI0035677C15